MWSCFETSSIKALFTFTFMHLADAFIQSDLHCIQVTVFYFFISSYINKGDSTKGLANQTYHIWVLLESRRRHRGHKQLLHVNNPFLRSRSNSNFPLAEEREFISGNGTLSTLCRSERSLLGSGKLAPWAIRKGDYNISLFKNVPGIEIC